MPIRTASSRAVIRSGDINAFFGLTVDNLTQMVLVASVLTGVFGLPTDIVLRQMIPGSVIGVLVGNLIYTRMAFELAARTGRDDVTAMPLGIDTPSLFAFMFGIVGPAFLATHDPQLTWRIASAVIVMVGLVKIVGAFFGAALRRAIPRAGLLGPIAGIAILLIAFFPSLRMMHNPIPGLLSLGIILVCLIGRYRFPGHVPGAFAAVVVGVGVYYTLHALGLGAAPGTLQAAPHELRVSIPWPTLNFLDGLSSLPTYLPLALPFALAVIVGGIDVTESASASGDDYVTRNILLTDGVATLLGGLCGAVVQTTPYIGHPAYKRMGGGSGYTLASGVVIGLGGALGYVSLLAGLVPEAVVAPILIFIGLEITAQAFHATSQAHYPAVAVAFIPVIANLVLIQMNGLMGNLGIQSSAFRGEFANTYHAILMLSNGFIITALLWSGALALIIDGKLVRASGFMMAAAGATLIGLIHSPYDNGRLFFPWESSTSTPWSFSAAYLLVAVWLRMMAGQERLPAPDAS